jgi:hypothetical protein
MSDDLDRRLRRYAERWRSTVPTFTLDPTTLTAPKRRWWPAVVAVVLVVALVGVGALLIRPAGTRARPTPPAA